MSGYPTQEFLHDPESGVVGDCWRACIAGLASLDMAEVPHFARDYAEGDDKAPEWWVKTREFIEGALPGFTIVCIEPKFPVYVSGGWPVVITSGPSPRGDFPHAVLADPDDGSLAWDPHPDRTGLAGPPRDVFAIVAKETTND